VVPFFFFFSGTQYINNIHGTGVLAIPIIYQQAGWVVPTLMLLLMSLVATFSGTLLCEAMSLIPGNDNFQRRVEFATCVKYYFSRRWYLASQVLFNVCLQVQLVAGIIVSASVMDEFIVFLFGRSYALEYYPSLRLTALTSATEPYAGLGALVSVGFVVAFLLCLPMGMFNLEAQMGIQWVSFFFMLAIHGEFFWQFFSVPSWAYTQTPAVGGDFSRVLGVIIFSFAHVISLPSWACEKKPDVSVTTTVWVATWFNFALYLATGLFGAWAYPHMKTADFLVVLARPHSPLATKIGVILFSLTAILPGLPVHSTIVRYNLFVSGYSHAVSYFWSNLFPWVFALWVYHSHMFSLILNWGALLASGAVSFLIPLALFVKARAVTAGFVDRAQHYHGVPRALRCAPATSIALTCLVVTFATIVFAISWDLYLLFQGQNVVTGD
jgi:amino acid permease